ncbi:hypothetical protein [Dictyobacter arantiisoli]|uniref:Uncharacterized protein n=1 Tax=Dictyobacter arantiisoli TaxID=2014874 RepID=A0A5A5TCN9_9CHLR|nr:hypothetical protein [Dictyobacter arantiisoli]GCF09078.1 hypothetical protein KDI_26420 [Dictyobacter arantiisoli]
MTYEAPEHDPQQLEHIMATVFTCRSIVKYNLTLGDTQKTELLDDIDTALEVLRTQLIAQPTVKPDATHAHPQSRNLFSPVTEDQAQPNQSGLTPEETLQSLYHMYHRYVDTQQSTSISTFIERFNDVMTTLNDIQRFAEMNGSSYEPCSPQAIITDPLQRIRLFISDIYYIFMDFMRLLSEVLQSNDVQLDTEKLSSLSDREKSQRELGHLPSIAHPHGETYSLSLLAQVYTHHQQLIHMKGHYAHRINESTAFLEFLKERFVPQASEQPELVKHIDGVVKLLLDMQHLLAGYERVAAALLGLGS